MADFSRQTKASRYWALFEHFTYPKNSISPDFIGHLHEKFRLLGKLSFRP